MHSVTRIWKGPEMEGPETGTMTYFIEATKLNDETVEFLRSFISSCPDCQRVYLGANTTDVVEFGKLFLGQKLPCNKVVMEIEGVEFAKHPELLNSGNVLDNIIVRQTVRNVPDKISSEQATLSFKLDVPNRWCQTWSTPDAVVKTNTVQNGLYDGVDVEVFRSDLS